jgi:hypothetical protein
MIPGAKLQVISDPVLDLVLNEGVKDIASYTACLKANKKFNVVAGQPEYVLSTEISDYLTVDKPGLWWDNGTKWVPVWPRTLKYLDENTPNWRDMENGVPRDYSIDGDILTVSPPPETALDNGFWLYYGKQPTPMTANEHYPFSGSTTELTHLSIFDFAIIAFAKWKIEPILNKDQDANLSMQEYYRVREEKFTQFKQRKDVANNYKAAFKGPRVRQ